MGTASKNLKKRFSTHKGPTGLFRTSRTPSLGSRQTKDITRNVVPFEDKMFTSLTLYPRNF